MVPLLQGAAARIRTPENASSLTAIVVSLGTALPVYVVFDWFGVALAMLLTAGIVVQIIYAEHRTNGETVREAVRWTGLVGLLAAGLIFGWAWILVELVGTSVEIAALASLAPVAVGLGTLGWIQHRDGTGAAG